MDLMHKIIINCLDYLIQLNHLKQVNELRQNSKYGGKQI